MSPTSEVKLHIHLVVRYIFSSILQIWYVEFRISRIISWSYLDFEMTCHLYQKFMLVEWVAQWIRRLTANPGMGSSTAADILDFSHLSGRKLLTRHNRITGQASSRSWCDLERHLVFNPCPAEPGYTLPLEIVWSRSVYNQMIWICTVFIQYLNLYQQPGSSILTGWKLGEGVASIFIQHGKE